MANFATHPIIIPRLSEDFFEIGTFHQVWTVYEGVDRRDFIRKGFRVMVRDLFSLRTHMLSIIIPANNEQNYIGPCLDSLLASDQKSLGTVEIIVASNASTDGTVEEAGKRIAATEARNWALSILDITKPGKANAINEAERHATGDITVYVDADVLIDPLLIGQLVEELSKDTSTYASGTSTVRPAHSWATRHYIRFWTRLPFMTEGVPGGGLYAVNSNGRSRWGRFPEIIADDTFVKLQFSPEARKAVPTAFSWPMPEGLANLVRVRRRANAGMAEFYSLYPELRRNEGNTSPSIGLLVKLAMMLPISFLVYITVLLVVKLTPKQLVGWGRGR